MDELGFNKVAGAVLATALGVMVLMKAPAMLIKDHYPDTPAYFVGELEKAETGDAEPLPFPQASWVGAMDAAKGAKVFNKCKSCHNVADGGANGTGPNLHNIVGNAAGSKAGFSYSAAMSGAGVKWGYEELDGFLAKPKAYLKGTKMAFIGLKKEEDRAAVIEYLRVSSSTPLPKPAAAAAEVMAPEMKDGAMKDGAMKDGAKDKAGAMVDDAKDKAGAMIDGAKPDVMVDGAKDKADAMIDGAKDKAGAMIDGAKPDIMVDEAKDKADAMIDGAKDKADAMIDGAKDNVGDKLGSVKDGLKDKVELP